MKYYLYFLLSVLGLIQSCSAQEKEFRMVKEKDAISIYSEGIKENKDPSISLGSVSNGALENGKLFPFSGNNFHYFDSASYLADRAFVNDKVRIAAISAYSRLETLLPERHFCIMECSHQHGGKLSPHRTHQNGLSIDFMTPLIKNGQPYYGLDSLGGPHYLLDFDDTGSYLNDSSVTIDFNTLALHILVLAEEAKKQGLKIEKVILKTELKDELFACENGKKLLRSGIYFTKSLTPMINALHDDHYHIDFAIL